MILFLHISSCGIVIIGQFVEQARKDGFSTIENAATWLIKYGNYDIQDGRLILYKTTYVKALYFTTTTVTTVGYGDLLA